LTYTQHICADKVGLFVRPLALTYTQHICADKVGLFECPTNADSSTLRAILEDLYESDEVVIGTIHFSCQLATFSWDGLYGTSLVMLGTVNVTCQLGSCDNALKDSCCCRDTGSETGLSRNAVRFLLRALIHLERGKM
jgi:hypothetical protein